MSDLSAIPQIAQIPGLTAALAAKALAASPVFSGPATFNGGTLTDPASLNTLNVTWNDAADTFDVADINVTDTASASASRFVRYRVGGVEKFSVRKDGAVSAVAVILSGALRTDFLNNAANDITHLYLSDPANLRLGSTLFQFNGTGNANSALKGSGTELQVRLADDSAFATLRSKLKLETDAPPATAADAGTAGLVRWDADYLYVCIAANTWKRTALATW